MGNTWSQKVENNTKIWNETFRNTKIVSLVALFFTLIRFRRSIFRLFKNNNNENKDNKINSKKKKSELFLAIFCYFIKLPLFAAIFSILFKKLIRMNYISHSLDINLVILPSQKYSITLMSFLLSYYMQQTVSIFHWKWSLLLLIRSLYGLIRLSIPIQYQLLTIRDLHTILVPIMGCIFVTKYAKSLPQSIKSTYSACLGYNQSKYINMFSNNSRSMPSCLLFHENQNQINCIKSMIKDSIFIVFPHSFSFFIKLHFISALIAFKRFQIDFATKPISLLFRIISNALRSTAYWAIGVHWAVRVCTCFNRIIVKKMYNLLDYIFNTQNLKKYQYNNQKNVFLLWLITSFAGRYALLTEPKGRQIELVLTIIWYEIVHILRLNCNLETNDNDKGHWLLGSNSFVSILFALSMAVNIYVYCKDAKYVKSMERNLIQKYLIQ